MRLFFIVFALALCLAAVVVSSKDVDECSSSDLLNRLATDAGHHICDDSLSAKTRPSWCRYSNPFQSVRQLPDRIKFAVRECFGPADCEGAETVSLDEDSLLCDKMACTGVTSVHVYE
jgi:hypothetical protein